MNTTIDRKSAVLDNLKILRAQEIANKQPFKAKAYSTVIKNIEAHEGAIRTIEDLAEIKGVGESIKEKLKEILETGFIERTKDAIKSVGKSKAIEQLMEVHGIGNVKANKLVEDGVLSIEQLKERVKLDPKLLNDKQKLGLCYHDDFIKRIPQSEMDKHNEFIGNIVKKIDPKIVYVIVGSYRRKAATSGDIDVLLTHPLSTADKSWFKQIVDTMRDSYLVDDLAYGSEKYLGICKLPKHKTYRRVDLLYIPPVQFPFALLYFTGSQDFNIEMRHVALKKGYSMSEHGFKYTSGPQKGEFLDEIFVSEEEIFEFLDIEYVKPEDRAKGAIKMLMP